MYTSIRAISLQTLETVQRLPWNASSLVDMAHASFEDELPAAMLA
jgi:hypothetical protein